MGRRAHVVTPRQDQGIHQGEVREFLSGKNRRRVLVVSSDAHNADPSRMPFAMPLRRSGQDAPPYLIAMADRDPTGGFIDVGRMAAVDPALLGPLVGLITGATMERVRESIHTLFAP